MQHIAGQTDGHTFSVAIIVSRFNTKITEALYEGAKQRLDSLGFSAAEIVRVDVPGAVEIPLIAKRMARSGKFAAIIALGVVIRGETTHYDYVCEQVSQGCQRVGLDHDIPVVFGVLTTENAEQALARAGGQKGHKGVEAVDVACEMVSVMQTIDSALC